MPAAPCRMRGLACRSAILSGATAAVAAVNALPVDSSASVSGAQITAVEQLLYSLADAAPAVAEAVPEANRSGAIACMHGLLAAASTPAPASSAQHCMVA